MPVVEAERLILALILAVGQVSWGTLATHLFKLYSNLLYQMGFQIFIILNLNISVYKFKPNIFHI